MTVREYLVANPDKPSYTIKCGRKEYACNIFDANAIFGKFEIKHIGHRQISENLVILTINPAS